MGESDRLAHLRDLARERGLDAVLVSHPANRFYLSGFRADDHGPDETSGMLLVAADAAHLYTGATNLGWATADAPGFDVRAWQRPWPNAMADAIKDGGWRRIGFEDDALTVAFHARLQRGLDGAAELVPLGAALNALRAVKDRSELDALRAVTLLTDAVFVDATADLQPGITERELAWRIERGFRDRGADRPAFDTIVASGPHAARPHHEPGDRPFAEGEPIVIDMGARLGGYNGDLTRTIWIGDPEPRLREIYGVVHAAQQAALGAIGAGVPAKDVDAAARAIIEAAGYADQFVHGTGHGLGIKVHEAPSASTVSEDVLSAGQVMTVEPGIYVTDWGGVRIEDVGAVLADGFDVFTTAPKRFV